MEKKENVTRKKRKRTSRGVAGGSKTRLGTDMLFRKRVTPICGSNHIIPIIKRSKSLGRRGY